MNSLGRRAFLGFLGGLAAAPIVRAFIPAAPIGAPTVVSDVNLHQLNRKLCCDYIRLLRYNPYFEEMEVELIDAEDFYVGSQWRA